jgi:hypothetical protein
MIKMKRFVLVVYTLDKCFQVREWSFGYAPYWHHDIQPNDTVLNGLKRDNQQNDLLTECHTALCNNSECHSADCQSVEYHYE